MPRLPCHAFLRKFAMLLLLSLLSLAGVAAQDGGQAAAPAAPPAAGAHAAPAAPAAAAAVRLQDLPPGEVSRLKEDFNRGAGSVRLLMILSPS
jgi:hypothetical protein